MASRRRVGPKMRVTFTRMGNDVTRLVEGGIIIVDGASAELAPLPHDMVQLERLGVPAVF